MRDKEDRTAATTMIDKLEDLDCEMPDPNSDGFIRSQYFASSPALQMTATWGN